MMTTRSQPSTTNAPEFTPVWRPLLMSGSMVRATLDDIKSETRRLAKFEPLEPGLNLGFSGLEVGHYGTDVPESGFVLYSRGRGGVWQQRTKPLHCPYGRVGDRLWIRETHQFENTEEYFYEPFFTMPTDGRPVKMVTSGDGGGEYALIPRYRATEPDTLLVVADHDEDDPREGMRWRPSIFMPRWASRIALEITSIAVERLHAITGEGARREGVRLPATDLGGGRVVPLLNVSARPAPNEVSGRSPREWTEDDYWRHAYAVLWEEINGTRSPWSQNDWVWVIGFRRLEGVRP